jgi:hypothetical protein
MSGPGFLHAHERDNLLAGQALNSVATELLAAMTFTRSFRQMICRVLIGTLLFAQLAVAAYACPGLSAMASAPPAGGTDMAMPCADMDAATPNLCAEHCRYGQQTADHAPAATPTPALLSLLYALPPALPAEGGAASTPASASVALTGAASPPLAILHCRWRI